MASTKIHFLVLFLILNSFIQYGQTASKIDELREVETLLMKMIHVGFIIIAKPFSWRNDVCPRSKKTQFDINQIPTLLLDTVVEAFKVIVAMITTDDWQAAYCREVERGRY